MQSMNPGLRRRWLQVHRWLALSLGGVLVLCGFLGSLLTVVRPLDQWAHPELFRQAAAGGTASLQQVRARLDQEFGGAADYTLRPPRSDADTTWVYVHGPWEGIVFFDASGRETGRRGEQEGVYNLLFELHSALLLGDTGKAILTIAAGSYLVLLVSGLLLWWPRRWPPSLRIHWRAPPLRALLELHNVGGALLGLLILVSVASGAYMAWPPLRALVSDLGGQPAVKPPKVPPTVVAAGKPPLDQLAARARTMFPGALVGYVQVPHAAAQAVRVRLKLPDDPHPNGLTSVWFHPRTGEVLKVALWSELDVGSRIVTTIYPLHTGALGGPLHQVVVGLTGLALATLGGSGLLLWWKRRSVRVRGAVRTA